MDTALTVEHARKSYRATLALDGVSLELAQGEMLALLGPNGAGKTTLVRSICGRVRLDRGRILILGKPPGAPVNRSQLGFVPQDLALYPGLKARENLEVFGRLHGITGSALREGVHRALKWTALQDRSEELAASFSGGMKRRLNIACGVMHQPRVVLLDEPTVGVDPQSRERIFEMLSDLRHAGSAILLTTHQLDEAEKHCDPIVIVDHGRVLAQGTLSDLITRTVGSARRVVMKMDKRLRPVDGFEVANDGRTVATSVDDVTRDVPKILARCAELGCEVKELEVHRPSLQDVFIHLTGRELRE